MPDAPTLTDVTDAALAAERVDTARLADALAQTAEVSRAQATALGSAQGRCELLEGMVAAAWATTLGIGDGWVAGALPVGQAVYPIPAARVVHVALTGSDDADGLTERTPKATFQAAYAAIGPVGWTIVARGGVYEQALAGDLTKRFTLQNYTNPALGVSEAVWFDGSKRQDTWTPLGDGTWRAPMLNTRLDGSIPDGYAGGVDPAWPMAPSPHMVHVDGRRLAHRPGPGYSYLDKDKKRVTPAEEKPGPGQFTIDTAAGTVRIGIDPTGREVRLSSLGRFVVVRANATIRGIGVRRYATTLTESTATLDISAPCVQLEHVIVEDCGQQSVTYGAGCTSGGLRWCTLRGAGLLGLHTNGPSGHLVDQCLLEGHNVHRWRNEPGAGAIKLSRHTDGMIRHSIIRDSACAGIWLDVSCRGNVLLNCVVDGVTGPGIEHEISRRLKILNCRLTRVGSTGIWALNAGETRIWNCLVDRADSFDIRAEEDSRAGNVTKGQNPDGTQDWRLDGLEVANTVLTNVAGKPGTWRVYVAAYKRASTAAVKRLAGIMWSTATPGSVSRMAAVKDATGNTATYPTPAALAAALPAGAVGSNLVFTGAAPTPAQLTAAAASADPLPADIAALLGVPAGTKVMGPVLDAPVARIYDEQAAA